MRCNQLRLESIALLNQSLIVLLNEADLLVLENGEVPSVLLVEDLLLQVLAFEVPVVAVLAHVVEVVFLLFLV